jgi:signal transduction histidine kinase
MQPPKIIKPMVSFMLLERSIVRQKKAEDALAMSRIRHHGLLQESRLLHKGMRYLAQATLASSEEAGARTGRFLQDDVAQMLLGLNVRLQVLRKEALANTRRIKQEIARTQRLAATSATAVLRAVHARRGAT